MGRGSALFLTFALLSSLFFVFGYVVVVLSYALADPNYQSVRLSVVVVGPDGDPIQNAKVIIYKLSEDRTDKLLEGYTDPQGTAHFTLKISREFKGTETALINGEYRLITIYKSHNFRAVALADNLLGSSTFSLDPTLMKWPGDDVLLRLEARPFAGVTSTSDLELVETDETYQFTQVHLFTSWNNITTRDYWPSSSKPKIQSKERWTDLNGNIILDWSETGSTTVTLDFSYISPKYTGKKLIKLLFEFKYRYERWFVVGGPVTPAGYVEYVYAVDTSVDPVDRRVSTSSWSGGQFTGYITHVNQGESIGVDITGGIEWTFSVGVSFGVSWPPGSVSVSVSLGITKTTTPTAKCWVQAGSWLEGYRVHIYDNGWARQHIYVVWEKP